MNCNLTKSIKHYINYIIRSFIVVLLQIIIKKFINIILLSIIIFTTLHCSMQTSHKVRLRFAMTDSYLYDFIKCINKSMRKKSNGIGSYQALHTACYNSLYIIEY